MKTMSNTEIITPVTGTPEADKLSGTYRPEILSGGQGNDAIDGLSGSDVGYGGSGDDILNGGRGDDILYGGGGPSYADMSQLVIAQAYSGSVTFLGEGAGFRNTLGMYKVDGQGRIENVEILFANASAQGSGGALVGGQSSVKVELQAGDRIGFFVLPDGYSRNGAALETGQYVVRDGNGDIATLDTQGETKLYRVDPSTGAESLMGTRYGSGFFHSAADPANGFALNPDAYPHTVGHVDAAKGEIIIGFEDLWEGGDKDFDDVVLSFDVGSSNATVLDPNIQKALARSERTWTYDEDGNAFDDNGAPRASENDHISGDAGNDQLFGMAGHDKLFGGDGNDRILGNSGDDFLSGEAGSDTLSGGKGNDTLEGGTGDDTLEGNTGDDTLRGGEGDDVLDGCAGDDTLEGGAGNDKLEGGSGADRLAGEAGNDFLNGGSGNDRLSGGSGSDELHGGAGDDLLEGDEGGDSLRGGSGDDKLLGGEGEDYLNGHTGADVLDGGDGDDRLYLGGGNDIATGGAGSDRFVFRSDDLDGSTDVITDFVHSAKERDEIDLRALGLASKPKDARDWIKENVAITEDGDVTVDLGGSLLVFESRGAEEANALFGDVVDGLVLI
jgi:Ca2+-binding RTX toxin-like protein